MKHSSPAKKHHYMYKIVRADGAYYYGIHSTDNMEDGYFGSGQKLRHSIKKHGRAAHCLHVVQFAQSRADVVLLERETVTDMMLRDPLCMNLRRGGGATAEEVSGTTRERLSASARRAEVWRNAMSPEANAKRAASLRGKKKTPEHIARSVATKLANLTDDTRWKLGSANRGKSWYNNGSISKMYAVPPEGWNRGRLTP